MDAFKKRRATSTLKPQKASKYGDTTRRRSRYGDHGLQGMWCHTWFHHTDVIILRSTICPKVSTPHAGRPADHLDGYISSANIDVCGYTIPLPRCLFVISPKRSSSKHTPNEHKQPQLTRR